MNSKWGRAFYWMMSVLIGTLFLLIGALGVALPWSDILRTEMITFLLEDSIILPSFGAGCLLIGLSILIYTFFSTRQSYVDIRTGELAVTLNENVVQHYVDAYWKDVFPTYPITSSIEIKKKAIYINANLPSLTPKEKNAFLEQVQKDLGDIFGRILGYPHEVFLTATVAKSSDRTGGK